MPTSFEAYDTAQASSYNDVRSVYPDELIAKIIDFHRSTGGQSGVLVDVGCGPGNSTRAIASHFDQAYGVDKGEAMIEMARAASAGSIHLSVGSAETFPSDLRLQSGSVDMVAASAAAHWFDMPKFWEAAKGVLKSGGTVALCGGGGQMLCHPATPAAAVIQASLEKLRKVDLKDFIEPGSRISENLYRDLLLPWTCDPPIDGFDQLLFVRKIWNEDGCWDDETGDLGFCSRDYSLMDLERGLNTSSAVTRWRDAFQKGSVGGEDCVARTMHEISKALEQANVDPSSASLRLGSAVVLLLLKKA